MIPGKPCTLDDLPAMARAVGRSVVVLTGDGRLLAAMEFSDAPKAQAEFAALGPVLTTAALTAAGWGIKRQ